MIWDSHDYNLDYNFMKITNMCLTTAPENENKYNWKVLGTTVRAKMWPGSLDTRNMRLMLLWLTSQTVILIEVWGFIPFNLLNKTFLFKGCWGSTAPFCLLLPLPFALWNIIVNCPRTQCVWVILSKNWGSNNIGKGKSPKWVKFYEIHIVTFIKHSKKFKVLVSWDTGKARSTYGQGRGCMEKLSSGVPAWVFVITDLYVQRLATAASFAQTFTTWDCLLQKPPAQPAAPTPCHMY